MLYSSIYFRHQIRPGNRLSSIDNRVIIDLIGRFGRFIDGNRRTYWVAWQVHQRGTQHIQIRFTPGIIYAGYLILTPTYHIVVLTVIRRREKTRGPDDTLHDPVRALSQVRTLFDIQRSGRTGGHFARARLGITTH